MSNQGVDEEKRVEIENIIRSKDEVYTGTAILIGDELLVAIQVNPWLGFKEQKVEKQVQKEIEEKYPELNVLVSSDYKMHWESQKLLEENNAGKLKDEVKKLKDLANKHDDKCGTSCFIEPIGGLTKHGHADSRVFMLLDRNGKPFKVLAKKGFTWQLTPFFRVEDVFGDCCATLRAVGFNFELGAPEAEEEEADTVFADEGCTLDPVAFGEIQRFKRTETCVTVDLNDFTAIQCIADVDLNIHHH